MFLIKIKYLIRLTIYNKWLINHDMKLSLVIPTYNEKENIQKLIEKIQEEFKENKIDGEIIIVDDNSPDGTGRILENLKKKTKNLIVVHRKGKLGLSSAVLEG